MNLFKKKQSKKQTLSSNVEKVDKKSKNVYSNKQILPYKIVSFIRVSLKKGSCTL